MGREREKEKERDRRAKRASKLTAGQRETSFKLYKS